MDNQNQKNWSMLAASGAALTAGASLAYLFKKSQAQQKQSNGSRDIAPGPPGLPFVGNMRPLRDPLNDFVGLHRRYGPIVRLKVGPRIMHAIADPEWIQYVLQDNNRNYLKGRGLEKSKRLLGEGLLTSEGALWRRQRRLIQPAFHRRRISHFAETMIQSTADMLARWETRGAVGQPMDVAEEMMHLTLDIVSKSLFSTALNEEEMEQVSSIMTPLLRFTSERISRPFDIGEDWPTPANLRNDARMENLNEIVYRIISTRRAADKEEEDLLGLLMAAQDEETGLGMSDEQLRDEVMTIFLAGHETTANLLSFTWYLLSQHVGVRERVQQEVDEVLQGQTPTAADVPSLTYTNRVIEEVLRLYPPAWILGRQTIDDDRIAGYHIPAGSGILISTYVTHHHPDYWDNPEGFDPDRFSPERKKERHRYVYLPFGGGPRLCIGNNFALTEAALVVAMVAQKYELNLVPGRPVESETSFTLRTATGVWVTPHSRS